MLDFYFIRIGAIGNRHTLQQLMFPNFCRQDYRLVKL